MDKITLEGMEFYGYHGAYEEERKLGQRFIVDLEMYGDFEKAGREDTLEESVDYAQVFSLAQKVVEEERYRLLEALTLRLCQELLGTFSRIEKVTVRVKKPRVPLQGYLRGASVEMTRGRS